MADNSPAPTTKEWVACMVAILAIGGFAVFIAFMLRQTGATDQAWTRSLYLLNGVEAIAFAAAGFLFGREVNRGRAENAEKRASTAEKKAEGSDTKASQAATRAKELETRGKAVLGAINAKIEAADQKIADTRLGIASLGGETVASLSLTDLKELQKFTQDMFA